MDLGNNPKKR
jgi:ribosome assembly protein RRB1